MIYQIIKLVYCYDIFYYKHLLAFMQNNLFYVFVLTDFSTYNSLNTE